MANLNQIVRKLALSAVFSFIGGALLLGGVIEPLLFATLQDHGVIKNPEQWVWAVVVALLHVLEARWFEIVGALLSGFAAGTWLDGILRESRRTNSVEALPRIPIGSIRWTSGIMEIGRHQSTGEVGAVMRVVVKNTTGELLEANVTMSGEINGKSSPNREISFKALIYAKSPSTLSYDGISDIPVKLDLHDNIQEVLGKLKCKITYNVVDSVSPNRVSAKLVEFALYGLPSAAPGNRMQGPTHVSYRDELES